LKEGEEITPAEIKPNQHFTEPPARYTEARLIKQMEDSGIGRPSTYAMIIDTIQARGYVTLERTSGKTRVFIPSEQGILTSEKLDEYFSEIINVNYTAGMEEKLDEIAEGREDEVKTLQEFYGTFTPLLERAYDNMEKIEPEKTGEVCPECGGELVYRIGRYGKFISCLNFPRCRYTSQLESAVKEAPEPAGKTCPECGGQLVKRRSRYGTMFIGCGNFPDCRYMENMQGERIYAKADPKAKTKTKKTKTAAGKKKTKEEAE